MPKYKIFAGLAGGFGGAQEHSIQECSNLENAETLAYEIACGEYDSYRGMHGLFNVEDALNEDPYLTDEDLQDMENDDRESWIDYYAELIEE